MKSPPLEKSIIFYDESSVIRVTPKAVGYYPRKYRTDAMCGSVSKALAASLQLITNFVCNQGDCRPFGNGQGLYYVQTLSVALVKFS
jgi:hypothetical protein